LCSLVLVTKSHMSTHGYRQPRNKTHLNGDHKVIFLILSHAINL